MEGFELPELNVVVSARCRTYDGKIKNHLIKRIKTKDTAKGWQWSGAEFDSYFTLEVIDWECLNKNI